MKTLRIAVADDEPEILDYFKEMLPRMNHQVACLAATGRELVEKCKSTAVDLVITDIKMPDMDGLDAAESICQIKPTPIILLSAYSDAKLIERALEGHIMAYLTKPIKQSDLEPAIALAMKRFEQFQVVTKEATDLRKALEDRKMIERAKGILMKRAQLSEDDAFRRLQRLSSDKNKKLAETAQMIVTADEAFNADGKK